MLCCNPNTWNSTGHLVDTGYMAGDFKIKLISLDWVSEGKKGKQPYLLDCLAY
jgi:hypothetical protein